MPVAAAQTAAQLGTEVDELVCLYTPGQFYAVGLWYGDFRPVTDDEVPRFSWPATHANLQVAVLEVMHAPYISAREDRPTPP